MKFSNSFKLNDFFYNNEFLISNCKEKHCDLLTDYQKIKNYYKFNDLQTIKFLYYNKKIIHRELYEQNIIIKLNNNDGGRKNLSYYFFLSLLIKDNPDFINYEYSIDYIKEIELNYQNKEKNKEYKELIIFKIILELLDNYEGCQDYDLDSDEIKIHRNMIIKRISNNISLGSELNLHWSLEDIMKKNIEELYIDIISAYIISKKFKDFEFINKIFKQLDLENIDITENMFKEIIKILDENIKNYANIYLITNLKDLLDIEKINFYYILLNFLKLIRRGIKR
jgi:hypothetical protein